MTVSPRPRPAAQIGASKAPSSFPSAQDGDSPLDFCGPGASMHVENPGATTATANAASLFNGNLVDRVGFWKACNNTACPFAGEWAASNVVGTSSH